MHNDYNMGISDIAIIRRAKDPMLINGISYNAEYSEIDFSTLRENEGYSIVYKDFNAYSDFKYTYSLCSQSILKIMQTCNGYNNLYDISHKSIYDVNYISCNATRYSYE